MFQVMDLLQDFSSEGPLLELGMLFYEGNTCMTVLWITDKLVALFCLILR